jgi:hypothetical protein
MIVIVIGGWSFVLFYLAGLFFGHSYAGDLEPHMALWTTLHGAVALITLISVTVLVWARLSGTKAAPKASGLSSYINGHHRLIGTITAIFWLLTQAGGFINLYIIR